MKFSKKNSNKLQISIIIITYKRINNVIDILKDLKSQSFLEFEVVLVSDGCKTAYNNKIKVFSKFFPIQYLDTGLKNKYGLATARNLGLKAAKSNYCILLDDDCRVSRDLVKHHYLNREPLTIIGGQRIGLGDEEIILKKKMAALRKLPHKKSIEISEIISNFPKISLIENNISFYKNDILKLGLFFDFIHLYGIIGQEFFNRCKNYKLKYKYIHESKIIHLSKSREVHTNKKRNKIIKSKLSNILILPFLKNYIFVIIYKNFLSKISQNNILHKFITVILWIFILVTSPFLILKNLLKIINSKNKF